MNANLQRLLINAGNEAKKRAKIDKMIEERNAPKEKKEEHAPAISKQLKPWTDEELFNVLNKANEANKNSDIKTLNNNSSNEDIIRAALNVLTTPIDNH